MQDDLDSVSFGAHRNLGAVMRLYVECDAIGPEGNGPVMEQAPAMAELLRELVPGVPAEDLRARAKRILQQASRGQSASRGEDGDK